MPQIVSPTGKPIILPPNRPNAGITTAYQREIDQLVADMHASLVYWVRAAYRKTPPESMAMDASPARALAKVLAGLRKRWTDNFATRARELALRFVRGSSTHTDTSMAAALKASGITVKFKTTRAQNDALQAQITENMALIKSIAAQHLTQVEGMVMRSVQKGRDLGGLVGEMERAYGVTRRRAAFIARDQNNKATATVTRVRRAELGITEAIWQHSTAGRVPRPSHVAVNGKRFDSQKGMLIEGEWLQPGEAINCRCFSRSVLPGFV